MIENISKYKIWDIDYFDLWKHCEDTGGRDKDRMVTIVTCVCRQINSDFLSLKV